MGARPAARSPASGIVRASCLRWSFRIRRRAVLAEAGSARAMSCLWELPLGWRRRESREGGSIHTDLVRPGGRRVSRTTILDRDSSLTSELRSPGYEAFDANRSK